MKKYPSKIILLGEYSVLENQTALAIPFRQKYAVWKKNTSGDFRPLQQALSNSIHSLASFPFLDYKQMEQDVKDGWYVQSTIPVGSGLGSSGAFCAAILDRYGREASVHLRKLHDQLRRIEGLFHTRSSGIDPLVSYLDTAIALDHGDIRSERLENLNSIYLWDSKISRRSKELIGLYQKKISDPAFRIKWTESYMPFVEKLMADVIDGSSQEEDWRRISEMQLELLPEMIPESVRRLWIRGLEDQTYSMKICGSGGGGYFLVYRHEGQDMELIPLG